jgi:hypothetical protein
LILLRGNKVREQSYKPVTTCIGELHGRDAIYLEAVLYDGHNLSIRGECNGELASNAQEAWVPYLLTFKNVMAFRAIELDSWLENHCDEAPDTSSFWEVIDSIWREQLRGKVGATFRHFGLQTYDDVFDVVCADYEFIAHPGASLLKEEIPTSHPVRST